MLAISSSSWSTIKGGVSWLLTGLAVLVLTVLGTCAIAHIVTTSLNAKPVDIEHSIAECAGVRQEVLKLTEPINVIELQRMTSNCRALAAQHAAARNTP